MTLAEILAANVLYQKKSEDLKSLYQELKSINDQLDLSEVEATMDYPEAKQLLKSIRHSINDESIIKRLEKIVEKKKIECYPEILGVHYYPILKELTLLSPEEQVKLDRTLKENYRRYSVKLPVSDEVIQFLLNHHILERRYEISCRCGGFGCDNKLMKESEYLAYLDFWRRREQGIEIPEEEEEALDYGYVYVYCDRQDAEIELKSMKDFEKYGARSFLTVIQEPDLTLENL